MRFKLIFILTICVFLVGGIWGFDFVFFQSGKENPKAGSTLNLALGRPITASSSAEIAQLLVDGQEQPNASWHTSWSPAQIPSRPSWVMLDLGQTQSIQRLAIVFSVAAYEGIYDVWAPPDSIVIEMGDSPDKMEPIEVISSKQIPDNGACADKRRLDVFFKKNHQARYVKLMFPTGGKLLAMPDVVGLGEVAVYGPEPLQPVHKKVTMEGAFGRIVVDVDAPSLVDFFPREPDGRLAKHSILSGAPRALTRIEAQNGKILHRQGAYTYVSDNAAHRFESRYSREHKVDVQTDPRHQVKKIIIAGIKLHTESGLPGPVEEDWILEKNAEGALSWKITQRWLEAFNVNISGTPALHLARFGGWAANRDRRVDTLDPQITSTIWYDPMHLKSGTHPDYETYSTPMATEYRTHTVDVPNTWAIYKLFTNFHLKSDLRLKVEGGYLFRRAGVRNDFNEVGSTIESEHHFKRQAGDISNITLTLLPVDKFLTGQQFVVDIPDQTLANALRDLHASVLNGGIISDPKRYHFGNGTEDANYAGSADFQARALSVSTELGSQADYPYHADKAFKGHLEQILATVDDRGLTHFGFNAEGLLIDDNLHVISAAKTYVIKTGDRAFVERHYPILARMIGFFMTRMDPSNGLFHNPEKGAHWYYDGIPFSGFNTYYQAFLYQALLDFADMADIVDKTNDAALYREHAKQLALAINTTLWFPDAPGGPRYADWIDVSGNRAAHFIDIAQYPLIAFGIAPPDRAEVLLKTADKRLAELKKQFNHTRSASLSLLWPLSKTRGERCFGSYFFGGSLLASTYWEVVARARAGHVDGEWGAYRLLQNFAKRFSETSFVGSNSIDIQGNISLGGDEGYLSDMVIVPAALVHGLLGVKVGWEGIQVMPKMPAEWKNAKTSLIWKGRSYEIAIQGDRTQVTPQ